ncbi:MAG TPA: transcriptional repressor LexA [Kiritimatiellia bacterium]|nr:transcriptional repressor LexA [Kiritimatiellia bacterium]
MTLTEKQKAVLDFIRDTITGAGSPPTIREIAAHFRFRSPRAASDHVATLIRKGFLERVPGLARSLRLTAQTDDLYPPGIPLVGNAAAGFPVFSEEHIRDHLHFDSLFGQKDLFALQVQGDSMIEAGIFDGDFVVVRRSPVRDTRAIVLAYVEGEATIKYLERSSCGIRLIPANPAYPVIELPANHPSFEVAGPVIGVVRSLQRL